MFFCVVRGDNRGIYEPFERLRDSGMKSADSRQPRGKHGFERVEAFVEGTKLGEPLAHRRDRPTPQVFERCMPFGQFVGLDAEERLSGAGPEHGAYGAERPGNVADVEGIPRAADDGLADEVARIVAGVIEQAQRIVGKPEGEVHPARRKNVLAAHRG